MLRGRGKITHFLFYFIYFFLILRSLHNFGTGKDKYFKFGTQIDSGKW